MPFISISTFFNNKISNDLAQQATSVRKEKNITYNKLENTD
jgi:hypothetical protein